MISDAWYKARPAVLPSGVMKRPGTGSTVAANLTHGSTASCSVDTRALARRLGLERIICLEDGKKLTFRIGIRHVVSSLTKWLSLARQRF